MSNERRVAVTLVSPDLRVRLVSACRQGKSEGTDLNRTVVAAAHEPELVARDGPHALDVPEERARDFARLDVPKLDRVVQAPGYEHRPLSLHAARR